MKQKQDCSFDSTKAAKQMHFGPSGQLYIFFFSGGLDHRASLARLAPASCECWRRARRKSIRPSNSIYLCWFPEQSDGFISSKREVTGINSSKPEVWKKGNGKQNHIIRTSYLILLTSTNLPGETVVSLRQYLNWIGRWTYEGHEPMARSVHPSDVLDILWSLVSEKLWYRSSKHKWLP